ncbi:hypothetical protein BV898_03402 [Hypsibius exemplaris]|uniref:G-protein coupled receptors family 1 profile domain-containing protein n=1 Tax=Hypsibius exemplaris TaxID=2072580 RepID=A0A1W0X4Y1_HYPEX|nr:hypothetical protein BV898_03402 [Hypsibius exemplaris]
MNENITTPGTLLIGIIFNLTNNATAIVSFNNGSAVNGTTTLIQQWNAITIVCLVTTLSGILGNGMLLYVFARERSLITPFNVYLINLLLLNFVSVLIQYPMDFISYLYDGAWLLGELACDAYLYAAWPLQTIVGTGYEFACDVAVNRVWAMVHPISYRNKHSIKTALLACAAVWIGIHAIFSPMVIHDRLYYRPPVKTAGCSVVTDKQIGYCAVLEYFIWQGQLIMTIAVPIIFFARRSHRRSRYGNRMAAAVAPLQPAIIDVRDMQAREEKLQAIQGAPMAGNPSPNGLASGSIEVVSIPHQADTSNNNATDMAAGKQKQGRGSSKGLLLLVLLTISANICWSPSNFYFTWILYQPIDNPVFYFVQYTLFAVQTTIDSIMITLAFPNLRAALKRFWTCQAPLPA